MILTESIIHITYLHLRRFNRIVWTEVKRCLEEPALIKRVYRTDDEYLPEIEVIIVH